MREYKRLTEIDEYENATYKQKCDADSFEENLYIHAKREEAVVNRLAELEDKIENGTLVEVDNKVYPPTEGVWSDCCSKCGQAIGNNGYIENYCSHCGCKLKELGEV